MLYAPIIVFAFNRLDSLKQTVDSLLHNSEATDSELYVFVDGPRSDKVGEYDKVRAVQEYVKTITGFKSVTWKFAEVNKGLGASVIAGVSEVIDLHHRAIVLEDDLLFSENFLSFMNQGLSRYENEKIVFSICGYTNTVKRPKEYEADSYFCTRSSSWGWATWKDRWDSVDWELNNWDLLRVNRTAFNKWGGSDCWKMLNDWHDGKNKSWAIRFCFAQFLQDKLSLFPMVSKVKNDGFDGQGTNCKKWSRFRCKFDTAASKVFCFPANLVCNEEVCKSALSYHSMAKRILSKFMYLIYR